MVVMVLASLVPCHGHAVIGSRGGEGFLFPCSGPGTARSWAPFNWNMQQCLDLWVGEI